MHCNVQGSKIMPKERVIYKPYLLHIITFITYMNEENIGENAFLSSFI